MLLMKEMFFTSKQAAEITDCTLRQLQYWREKGVVVPTISATGTGRSVYYSEANLLELAVMVHFLSVGLNFDLASETLKTLEDKEPELFTTFQGQGKRFMLLRLSNNKLSDEGKLSAFFLMEFDRDKAIASLDEGKPVIPVWLDQIYQQLQRKLGASHFCKNT